MNKTWLVNCASAEDVPTALEAQEAKPAQRNFMMGQHDGSVISCSGSDHNLSLYVCFAS